MCGKNHDSIYTYRNQTVLQYLYVEQDCSQAEIAEHFGVSKSTICRWCQRLGVSCRNGEHGAFDIDSTKATEYARYRTRVGGSLVGVREHQLLALADGADPFKVFGSDHHIHHSLPTKVALNVPENVKTVTRRKHRQIQHPRNIEGTHEAADTASTLAEIGFEQSGVPLDAIRGLDGSRLCLDADDTPEEGADDTDSDETPDVDASGRHAAASSGG